MPIQYSGIIAENRAVRAKLGVFDISHMGQITVAGSDANTVTAWLDGLLTNNVASLQTGQGQYTLLLNTRGGVIDDLIIYRTGISEFLLVVNASKTTEDFQWLSDHAPDSGITLADVSDQFAGLAVQGPHSAAAFQQLFGAAAELPDRFCMTRSDGPDGGGIICRTGYTGEDGFEFFCAAERGPVWWQRCLDAGAVPCGLGARDSLRLEKCYPLNGADLSPDHTPLEAGLGFAVDLHKPEFIGQEPLIRQRTRGLQQRLVAIRQTGKSPPPRHGYAVWSGDQSVGTLTSGGVSPNLNCGISMAYIQADYNKVGTKLEVEIRSQRFPAEVVRKPFV